MQVIIIKRVTTIRTLRAQHIVKVIRKRSVVKNVTVELSRGEAVGILGPNGAGKTTLFSIISGELRPDSGQILMDTSDVTRTPMYFRSRLGICYLPQDTSLFRGLTVGQNIEAVLELFESDYLIRQRRLSVLLDQFSLNHLRQASPLSLSGGERRRVEIARALATNPIFLLLDEPFSGVDPIAIQEIKTLLLTLKQNDIGILITDHNVRDTLNVVDRAYIIANGEVVCSGSPEALVENEKARLVYLGERFSI